MSSAQDQTGIHDQAEAAERDYQRFVEDHLGRNYAGHFLHGMLGMTGFRLVNAPIFMPAYLFAISGSDAIVGLGLGLQNLGGIISPIIGASHIEHRKRVLPASILLGGLMRFQILGIAIAGWFLTGRAELIAVLTFLFLMGLFMGPQRVAFQFLLSKAIPIERRGRLNAWRNFAGGLIAAILSYYAGRYLIEHDVLGNGYATTFFLAFILTWLGLGALALLMREPEPPIVRARVGLQQRLREIPALLREDKAFGFFVVARSLAMGGRLSAPFYILFAGQTVPLTGTVLGVLSLAFMGSDTLMNLFWGYFTDRRSFYDTFLAATSLWILGLVLLLMSNGVVMIFVSFCVLGAAMSGMMLSTQGLVLEFGAREDLPMRLAFSNSVETAMLSVTPFVGGILAVSFGYPTVFVASAVLLSVALFLTLRFVENPRRRVIAASITIPASALDGDDAGPAL